MLLSQALSMRESMATSVDGNTLMLPSDKEYGKKKRETKHQATCSTQVGPDIVLAIAANKEDLASQRAVPEAESRAFAEAIGASHHGTSAKTGKCLVQSTRSPGSYFK